MSCLSRIITNIYRHTSDEGALLIKAYANITFIFFPFYLFKDIIIVFMEKYYLLFIILLFNSFQSSYGSAILLH